MSHECSLDVRDCTADAEYLIRCTPRTLPDSPGMTRYACPEHVEWFHETYETRGFEVESTQLPR